MIDRSFAPLYVSLLYQYSDTVLELIAGSNPSGIADVCRLQSAHKYWAFSRALQAVVPATTCVSSGEDLHRFLSHGRPDSSVLVSLHDALNLSLV
jgi:hypothetical protein